MVQGAGAMLAFATFVFVVASMRRAVNDVPYGFWQRSGMRLEYLAGLGSVHSRAALDQELYRVADYSLGANRSLAQELRERTNPNDPVYVWGFEPSIYWLSGRRPSSRFIYNVPQRAQWQQEHARRLLTADLDATPPAMIVVQHNDIFPVVTGDNLDSSASVADFPWLSRLLAANYEQLMTTEDFDLYGRLQPVSGPATSP
jgi:hypothetical protein